jgi:uncharacterized protein
MEVIIKPTEACNGTCVYCAADGRPDRHKILRGDQLGHLFEVFADWLRRDPRRQLRFIWHGGEPMLCGPEYYLDMLAQQRLAFGEELPRVKNAMQSNLSLVDERWIPCLRELMKGQAVGTSFDIIEGVRGLAGGRDLREVWVHAVRLLHRHGIRVGIVYVAHRKSLGRARDIYHFFRNLDPRLHMRVNPLYREGRAGDADSQPLWTTAEEYGQFLVDLCEVWLADRMRFTIMPLMEWRRAWQGDDRLCCDSRGTCTSSHLGINPDGTVFGCGRASDHGSNPLGNIFEDDLDQMLGSRAGSELATRSARLRETRCKDCRYWQLCHGGCPMMGLLYYGDLMRETYFCEARKRLFTHFESLFGPPAQMQTRGRSAYRPPVLSPPLQEGARGGRRSRQVTPPPFTVTLDHPAPWPMADAARIVTPQPDLPRLTAGRVEPQERIRLFVTEARFAISPAEYASFRGQLTVLADNPGASSRTAILDSLRELCAELAFSPATIGDGSPLKMAADQGVPVRLQCAEDWPAPVLLDLLDYFLHSPKLEVPVEPFFSLAAAIGRQRRTTLWQSFDSVPGRSYFVDQQRRVSLSRPWAERGRFFGSVDDDPASLRRSPLWTDLQALRQQIFITQSPCAFCEHYLYCAGFWRAAFESDVPCNTWRQVMDRMTASYTLSVRALRPR